MQVLFTNPSTCEKVNFLYQWETNIDFTFDISNGSDVEVAFSTVGIKEAIRKKCTKTSSGAWTCKVPDTLLQYGTNISAYITFINVDSIRVVDKSEINVIRRTKPAGYVSTIDDTWITVDQMLERIAESTKNIEAIENNIKSSEVEVKKVKEEVDGKINDFSIEFENYVRDFELLRQQAVADVNNAGQTQTELVEEAGAAQISAINSSGEQQIKAVEDAGAAQVSSVQEAAADIIADRDQISENKNGISELKGDLEDLQSFVGTSKRFDFSESFLTNIYTGLFLRSGVSYLLKTKEIHEGTINAFIKGDSSNFVSLTNIDKIFIPTSDGELVLYNYGTNAGNVNVVVTVGLSKDINEVRTELSLYNEKISTISKEVKRKISFKIPNGKWKEFDYPSGFLGTYKPVKIFSDGHFWKTDYNKEVFKNTSDNAKTYYVSPDGKWNNAGTRQSPYSLYQAVKKAVDGDTIIMLDGEYRIDNHESFGEMTALSKSVNIIGEGNPKWIVGTRKTFTFDSESGLYKLTTTNAQKVLDDNGILYETVSSLSACQSTQNTTYSDGTNIYANIDGEMLQNVIVLVYAPGFDIMPTNKNVKVYIENVLFYGGMWNIRTGSTADCSCEIICESCEFAYQVDNARSGVMVRSSKAIFVNCDAHDAMQDGFQYTKMSDGNGSCGFVEINCNGYSNGHIETNDTCNGSTSHSGICGIRINGNYYDNHGGNVADVQTDTQSINCGCTALNSCASDNSYKQGFGLQQAGATMWLYDCIAVGNFYDFFGVPDTIINAERCHHARNNFSYDYSGTLVDNNAETLEYKNLFRNLMLSQSENLIN